MYVLQRAGTRERVSARARYLFYFLSSRVRTVDGSDGYVRASARARAYFVFVFVAAALRRRAGFFFTLSELVSSALSETSAAASSSMSSVDLRDLNSPA